MGRVLILEPQPELRELLARVVARMGHDAIVGAGAPARDLLPLDAVILEPNGARGLLLAQELRSLDGRLPIVCVSVLPPTPSVRALEPSAFLMKPFGLDELESKLRDVIGSRAAAQS